MCILSLASCDILKQTSKQKKDIAATEEIETRTTRKGDTIRLEIPKITYKDTTIVKTNYVNRTEARVRYDNAGNVAAVECISAEINELRRELRTITDNSKEKTKDKEENFRSDFIIYIMAGVVIIFMFFIWRSEQKINKVIDVIARKDNQ